MAQQANSQQAASLMNGIIYELYGISQGARPVLLRDAAIVADPASFQTVVTSADVYHKDFALLTRFGRSRFDTNGPDWHARRDITQRHYVKGGSPAQAPRIERMFDAAFADPAFAHSSLVERTVFATSLRILLETLNCACSPEPILPVIDRIRSVFRELQYLEWSSATETDIRAAETRAAEALAAFGDLCAREPELGVLLRAFAEENPADGFDPLSELAVNMIAGAETTAAAICWVIDRLGCNPKVQDRISAEIRDGGATQYLDAMINETLRYFPPIPFTTRRVAEPTTLGDRPLSEGRLLLVSIVGLHQNASAWTNPSEFQSARTEFLDGAYDRRAFAPFLAGPRVCGGLKLARIEIRAAVSAFLRRYRVERDNDDVRIDYALAMRPASWDAVHVVERRAA